MSAVREGEKKADARLLWRLLFLFKLAFLSCFLRRWRLLTSSYCLCLRLLALFLFLLLLLLN